jgi:ketosteroid isomerase-like protein
MITLGPYDCEEEITIGMNDITGSDKLLALSAALDNSEIYQLPVRKANRPKTMLEKMRNKNIEIPVVPVTSTENKKKKRNAKDGVYQHFHKVGLAVQKLRDLRAKHYVKYAKVVGCASWGKKAAPETYDARSQEAIDRASMFLSALANGTVDKEDLGAYVHDDVVLSIPAFASIGDHATQTTFEGLPQVREASQFLTRHLLQLMSKTVEVKPSFHLDFDVVVNRKVAISASTAQFASPFVWVTKNLDQCGFTKEDQIHGLIRSDCDSEGKITHVKIYFDPSRLSHLFGSAYFNPL